MSVLASHFEEIEPGDRFATPGRTITEADVVGFAALTGDNHPQHTDAEWAAAGRFGERIAHGMLVLSYAAGLVPSDPDRVVALRRVGDAVFKAPVRLGDTIHVEGSVEEKRELDEGHGLVTCRWRVVNQRDKLVARVSVDAVWKREPAPVSEDSRQPVLI
jgi:3-hydroxybutyryl-CoA dehydratase